MAAVTEKPSNGALKTVVKCLKWTFAGWVLFEVLGQAFGRTAGGRCACPLCMALNFSPTSSPTREIPAQNPAEASPPTRNHS